MTQLAQRPPDCHTHGDRDPHPGVTGEKLAASQTVQQRPKTVFDEQSDEEPNHRSTNGSYIVQHLTESEAFLARLRLREMLPEKHQAIDRSRDEKQRQLSFPAPLERLAQVGVGRASEHQSGRPTGVKDIQEMRSVVGEERGHERIGHRLKGAIRQRENERPRPEVNERRFCCHALRCAKGHQGRQKVQRKGDNNQLAVTDLVRNQAADDDSETEPGKARAVDQTGFQACEPKLGRPDVQNVSADRETDARSQNGHEAGEKKAFGIRCDGDIAHFCVAHRSSVFEFCSAVHKVNDGSFTIAPPFKAD